MKNLSLSILNNNREIDSHAMNINLHEFTRNIMRKALFCMGKSLPVYSKIGKLFYLNWKWNKIYQKHRRHFTLWHKDYYIFMMPGFLPSRLSVTEYTALLNCHFSPLLYALHSRGKSTWKSFRQMCWKIFFIVLFHTLQIFMEMSWEMLTMLEKIKSIIGYHKISIQYSFVR